MNYTLEEIQSFANLNNDELFIELTKGIAENELFSRDSRINKGKKIFQKRLKAIRIPLCQFYQKNKDRIENSTDLILLIAPFIYSLGEIVSASILPFCALIAKIGISEICKEIPTENE